jgi:hypothetical protein
MMISSARYWYRPTALSHSGVLASSATLSTIGAVISGAGNK